METIDWWDREVAPEISFSERTFSQTFVEDEGREIEDPIDPANVYSVFCTGIFDQGVAATDYARVEGTPPG